MLVHELWVHSCLSFYIVNYISEFHHQWMDSYTYWQLTLLSVFSHFCSYCVYFGKLNFYIDIILFMSFSYKTILTLNYQIEKYQMANPFSILIDILNLFSYIVFPQKPSFLLSLESIIYSFSLCSMHSVFLIFFYLYDKYIHFFFSGSKVIERNYIILMAGIEIRIFTFEPT